MIREECESVRLMLTSRIVGHSTRSVSVDFSALLNKCCEWPDDE